MAEELDARYPSESLRPRRNFVKTSLEVAVTAPAVALLLSAGTKPAGAQVAIYQCACGIHILDDFTFGSSHEDIDAITLGGNFNPINGAAQQDDHI